MQECAKLKKWKAYKPELTCNRINVKNEIAMAKKIKIMLLLYKI